MLNTSNIGEIYEIFEPWKIPPLVAYSNLLLYIAYMCIFSGFEYCTDNIHGQNVRTILSKIWRKYFHADSGPCLIKNQKPHVWLYIWKCFDILTNEDRNEVRHQEIVRCHHESSLSHFFTKLVIEMMATNKIGYYIPKNDTRKMTKMSWKNELFTSISSRYNELSYSM